MSLRSTTQAKVNHDRDTDAAALNQKTGEAKYRHSGRYAFVPGKDEEPPF